MADRARRIGALGISLGASFVIVSAAPAQVEFVVDSVADEIDDDTADGLCHTESGSCTLRAAVMQANQASGAGATIVLPAGNYSLIRPAADSFGDDNGDLYLTDLDSGDPVIDIVGAGAATTIIDANQIDSVFEVHAGRTASISGVTLRNGFSCCGGGGIDNNGTLTVGYSQISGNHSDNDGGGIRNSSSLTLHHSTVSGNSATDSGGGIDNGGTLDVRQCTISDNSAIDDGGGIRNDAGGVLYLTNSTISRNRSNDNGGGIFNSDFTASTF